MQGMGWRRVLAASALCGCAWAAQAGEAPGAQCEAPTAHGSIMFPDREETISSMEEMPENCLKTLVVLCGRSANQGLLDLGSAAMCSMGYEALLRKGFGGSFHAMMAWWRGARAADEFAP